MLPPPSTKLPTTSSLELMPRNIVSEPPGSLNWLNVPASSMNPSVAPPALVKYPVITPASLIPVAVTLVALNEPGKLIAVNALVTRLYMYPWLLPLAST